MSVSNDNTRIVKAVLIGLAAACVVTLLLSCAFGLVLKMTSGLPYGIIDYVSVGIEAVSVLIGAYIACVISKNKGLVIGAAIGLLSVLILLCCGFILPENNIGILTLIRCAALLICGVIGGIAGVNKKEKVRIK